MCTPHDCQIQKLKVLDNAMDQIQKNWEVENRQTARKPYEKQVDVAAVTSGEMLHELLMSSTNSEEFLTNLNTKQREALENHTSRLCSMNSVN